MTAPERPTGPAAEGSGDPVIPGMVTMGDAVMAFLARFGIADPATADTIEERWAEIAGPPWAEVAHPVVLRDGELVVEAPAPAVRMLRYGVTDLVRRLDDALGEGVVRTVTVRPARGPADPPVPPR